MLTPQEIEDSTNNLSKIYDSFEKDLLALLGSYLTVESIKKIKQGLLNKEINRKVSQLVSSYNPKLVKEITATFKQAAQKSIKSDNKIFLTKFSSLEVINLVDDSLALMKKALLEEIVKNNSLVRTSAISTVNNFKQIVTVAYKGTLSGELSATKAIANATNQLVAHGFSYVDYKSGYKLNVRSASALNIRTSLKQTTMQISLNTGKSLGWDYYEVSSHAGCAPDHYWIQGKVVKYGSSEYNRVLEALQRPNCRHSMSPYLKGVSTKSNKVYQTEAENEASYKAQQEENRRLNEKRKQALDKKVASVAK